MEKAKVMNPVVLAFVGDAVYSLVVRTFLSTSSDKKSGVLSEKTATVVNAVSQAKLADKLFPIFTEDEADIYRRARNAKKPSRAKHSTVSEYNKSTGFEAVVGFLYLTGQEDRLVELLQNEEALKDLRYER